MGAFCTLAGADEEVVVVEEEEDEEDEDDEDDEDEDEAAVLHFTGTTRTMIFLSDGVAPALPGVAFTAVARGRIVTRGAKRCKALPLWRILAIWLILLYAGEFVLSDWYVLDLGSLIRI